MFSVEPRRKKFPPSVRAKREQEPTEATCGGGIVPRELLSPKEGREAASAGTAHASPQEPVLTGVRDRKSPQGTEFHTGLRRVPDQPVVSRP